MNLQVSLLKTCRFSSAVWRTKALLVWALNHLLILITGFFRTLSCLITYRTPIQNNTSYLPVSAEPCCGPRLALLTCLCFGLEGLLLFQLPASIKVLWLMLCVESSAHTQQLCLGLNQPVAIYWQVAGSPLLSCVITSGLASLGCKWSYIDLNIANRRGVEWLAGQSVWK